MTVLGRGGPPIVAPEVRFWTYVRRIPDGCWEWTGGKKTGRHGGSGYGVFETYKRSVSAHRFAYELLVGPIKEGLTLDHLCRNRGCVNPAHLEPVTLAENTDRAHAFRAQFDAAQDAIDVLRTENAALSAAIRDVLRFHDGCICRHARRFLAQAQSAGSVADDRADLTADERSAE